MLLNVSDSNVINKQNSHNKMKSFTVLKLIFLCLLLRSTAKAEEDSERSCFCSVYGNTLDDCPCTADTVDSLNDDIHKNLMKMLSDDYFRYFQVDFRSPCKWGWDATCMSPNCAVDTCDMDTLSETVRNGRKLLQNEEDANSYFGNIVKWIFVTFPYLEHLYSRIGALTGISPRCDNSDPYPQYHDVDQFCKLDPLSSEECDFVDLVKNPEQFTGYSGAASHQVWNTIYDELCFHPEENEKTLYLNKETIKKMCVEKRAFYKLVSGVHSSISVHLCSKYLLEDGNTPVWGRNFKEFQNRFSPESTNNEGPERIKNIFFLYLLELRAVEKVSRVLLNNIELSESTLKLLEDITEKIEKFPHHFQEKDLFKDEKLDNPELLQMFRNNFMKISELMDCLGCERCKVWGKLQMTGQCQSHGLVQQNSVSFISSFIAGIGTALKILLNQDPTDKISLTKHEIVALLNSLGRHSTSLTELKHFRDANL